LNKQLRRVSNEKPTTTKIMSDNDDDLCIPRSAMYKLVKELVPQVRLSGEAKDLIVTACNEFIHLLASEANNVCEKQSKKLILPDHVLLALDNIGFGEYKQDCVSVMKQMQEEADKKKKLRNKLDRSGIPEEELLRQQNQLFAEARMQQEMLDNSEWARMQQEAQLALQRQASSSSAIFAADAAYGGSHSAAAFAASDYGLLAASNRSGTANGSGMGADVSFGAQLSVNGKNKRSIEDEDDNYD
jgi:down-regulator of transcription 1